MMQFKPEISTQDTAHHFCCTHSWIIDSIDHPRAHNPQCILTLKVKCNLIRPCRPFWTTLSWWLSAGLLWLQCSNGLQSYTTPLWNDLVKTVVTPVHCIMPSTEQQFLNLFFLQNLLTCKETCDGLASWYQMIHENGSLLFFNGKLNIWKVNSSTVGIPALRLVRHLYIESVPWFTTLYALPAHCGLFY